MNDSNLANSIDLNNKNQNYNFIDILVELDKSDISNLSKLKQLLDRLISMHTITVLVYQIITKDTNMLNKLSGQ